MNKHKSVKKSKKMEDEYVLAKDGTGLYEPKGGYVSRQQLDRAVADARRELLTEIHDRFVELAIQGKDDDQELKGIYLYVRTLQLLKTLKKETK